MSDVAAEVRSYNQQLAELRQNLADALARAQAAYEVFAASPEGARQIQEERQRKAERLAAWRARPHPTDDPEVMEHGTARCIGRFAWLFSEARLYKLASPVSYGDVDGARTRFVIVSRRDFETMAFAADAHGELMPDGEHTDVSVVSGPHHLAIEALGFAVTDRGDNLPIEPVVP